jgi:hypothetical protein
VVDGIDSHVTYIERYCVILVVKAVYWKKSIWNIEKQMGGKHCMIDIKEMKDGWN